MPPSRPASRKVPAIVRDSAEAERLQTALIENIVREDLNPVDEARACAALVEDLGLSKEELARRRRPQPPRDLQPDPPARPARRGDRAARVRRAQRGPRPAPSCGPRQRRPPPPRPRRRSRRLVGARDREPRQAGQPARQAGARTARRLQRRGGARRCGRPRTARGGARPRGQGAPAGRPASRSSSVSRTSTRSLRLAGRVRLTAAERPRGPAAAIIAARAGD